MVKVMRGGGWWFPMNYSSAMQRDLSPRKDRGDNVGFRVVCNVRRKGC
jgi:formylglycine-generating enzyme required for sulfatase activity